ncbi:MAG: right-handed parallel beta-helix repeat-containing protein [Pirellulaceae bacterium]|nr:right-handed parallel beta-helix repeat-containing protein [Pirellulaceae bacterium]
MRPLVCLTLLCVHLCIHLCYSISQVAAFELFVSPQGNDAWSGTLSAPNADNSDGPLATLQQARELVRAQKRKLARQAAAGVAADNTIIITLRAGVHRLSDTLQLGAADSGTEQSPVLYRAFPNERPVITGAVEVNDFQPDTKGIYKATIPAAIKDPSLIRLVLHQQRRLPNARWPNRDPAQPIAGGWAYADGQRTSKPSDTVPGETAENRSKFMVRKADIRRWQNPSEGELFIFTRYNYWNDVVGIQSVNPATGQLDLKKPCSYDVRPGDRYFVQGLREELDASGEWYVDRQARNLLIYTQAANPKFVLEVVALPVLIGMRAGATDIRFEKLTFEGCTGVAINALDATRCAFIGCTFQHLGDVSGHGLAFYGGQQNKVIGCDIFDIGGSGIYFTGGDYKTLTPAGHIAQNNHIHHTGVITKHSGGIWLSGVGNSALNNEIHDCPRMGVMMPYGDNNQRNVVEYNHVHHVNLETQDSGAIYASGRDWVSGRGHLIRYNYIHDSVGFGWDGKKWATPYFAWGIYLDDACSSTEIVGNVMVRCSRAGLMVHSGRNNLIANNIFVDNGQQQLELSGWKADYSYWQSLLETMDKRYQEVIQEPAWKEMAGLVPPRETASASGEVMVDNVIERNIVSYNGRNVYWMNSVNLPMDRVRSDYNLIFSKGQPPVAFRNAKINLAWKAWQALGADSNSKQGDPRFQDAAKDNYRLEETSPAFKLGFKAIPFEKIGAYADPNRASWPLNVPTSR